MKIMVSIGTRPEIIKMAPLIKLIENSEHELFLLHTNQHYDQNMDKIFFDQFEIQKPKINLNIGSTTHGIQSAKIIMGVEKFLNIEKPDVVFVHGDTNTTLGTSIAVSKTNILLAHVESGLRSYDRTMPEEINRIISDHISDICYAPTEIQSQILLNEGIKNDQIRIVGNTISDSIEFLLSHSNENSIEYAVISSFDGILTLHRPSNVDDSAKLFQILKIINEKLSESGLKILFPCHPRTQKNLINKERLSQIEIIDPIGYFEFIKLLKKSNFVLTDSGGIQEEAAILKVPCITIRENTERPETLEIGANKLWSDLSKITFSNLIEWALNHDKNWNHPYGDGSSSHQIISYLEELI